MRSAGIAAHPDIERQNGSPVVPPLVAGVFMLISNGAV